MLADGTTRGLKYFGLVFAAGFVLGTVRTLWLEPRIGPSGAELAEQPLMLVVIFLAARRVTRGSELGGRAVIGVVALALLLVAEFGVLFLLRRETFAEYMEARTPLAHTVYAVALGAFALMPTLVNRSKAG